MDHSVNVYIFQIRISVQDAEYAKSDETGILRTSQRHLPELSRQSVNRSGDQFIDSEL